jgi:hypothetical protein
MRTAVWAWYSPRLGVLEWTPDLIIEVSERKDMRKKFPVSGWTRRWDTWNANASSLEHRMKVYKILVTFTPIFICVPYPTHSETGHSRFQPGVTDVWVCAILLEDDANTSFKLWNGVTFESGQMYLNISCIPCKQKRKRNSHFYACGLTFHIHLRNISFIF